jgi:hypothetical protein
MIDVVLISPETPSQNGPKMKISLKNIVNFTNLECNTGFALFFLPFEATAL